MRAFKTFALVLVSNLIISSALFAQIMIGDVSLDKNPNLLEKISDKILSKTDILISRTEYIISYNRLHRQMNWAAWQVTSASLGSSGRSKNFNMDFELEKVLAKFNEHAVGSSEYKGSCFDRGHQVPSGDRTDTIEHNASVFYMSNMIPQTAYVNKGAWGELENYAREKVQNESKVAYIIAGPIFDENFGKIGPNKDITVPSKNFKIVVFLEPNQTINDINAKTEIVAVIMPNLLSSGKKPFEDQKELCEEASGNPQVREHWRDFQTSLEEIEKQTGYSFISKK